MSTLVYSLMKEANTQGESTETTQLRSRSSLLCDGEQIQPRGDDVMLMQAQEWAQAQVASALFFTEHFALEDRHWRILLAL